MRPVIYFSFQKSLEKWQLTENRADATLADRLQTDSSYRDSVNEPRKDGSKLPRFDWACCARPGWFPPDVWHFSCDPFPSKEDLAGGMRVMRRFWGQARSEALGLSSQNLITHGVDLSDFEIPEDP